MADSETPGRGSDESPEVCYGCTEHPATSCDDARAQSRSYVPRMAASGARDLDLLEVDKYGLDLNDRNILLTIIDKFAGGPVGLDTLAAAIGEDAGTIEDVYEPYLVKNGFINRTPKGRVATDLAFEHFERKRA